jgi:hypothetical protein
VNVDTGQFAALRDQVADLTEMVRQLTVHKMYADTFWEVGYQEGQNAARTALLGRAAGHRREVRPRGPRPSHLRSVDGGAS